MADLAQRALALLMGDRGVTTRYALAVIAAGLVEEEDLRGHYLGWGRKRWFLA